MAPVEGSMDTLSQAVLSEARAQADKVLADARAKADAIRQRAEGEATAARDEIMQRAAQEVERIRRQATSAAQIQARTQQLEHREKLLSRVFDSARQQLSSVQQWSDYDQIACQLLREALSSLDAPEAVVRADKTTRPLLADRVLNEISNELKLELHMGEPLEHGTGVVVETKDGRRRYDNTLETRLSRMQDSLRSPVYHVLMGE